MFILVCIVIFIWRSGPCDANGSVVEGHPLSTAPRLWAAFHRTEADFLAELIQMNRMTAAVTSHANTVWRGSHPTVRETEVSEPTVLQKNYLAK